MLNAAAEATRVDTKLDLQDEFLGLAGGSETEIDEAHESLMRKAPELVSDPSFEMFLAEVKRGFLLAIEAPLNLGERRIFKFRFLEAYSLSRTEKDVRGTIDESLGWAPTQIELGVPSVGLGKSYHMEVNAPPGLNVSRLRLLAGRADRRSTQVSVAAGAKSLQHAYLNDVGRGAQGVAQISFRPARRGWLRATALSALLQAALFVLGAVWLAGGFGEIASIADALAESASNQGAVSVVVAITAVLGTLLARPGEHALASDVLFGVRVLIVILGIVTFLGAAALAVLGEFRTLVAVWNSLTWTAVVLSLLILMTFTRETEEADIG